MKRLTILLFLLFLISMPVSAEIFIPSTPKNLSTLQGNFWINHSWQQGTENIFASDTIQYSNDSVSEIMYTGEGGETFKARKTLFIPQNYTGSWKISYEINMRYCEMDTYGNYAAQIYKNNQPYGILRNSMADFPLCLYDQWYEYNETFTSILINTSDKIEVWANITLNRPQEGSIRNFRLKFDNNISDSYNISVNGTWTNRSVLTYKNIFLSPHGRSNISVWAWNNSGTGSKSLIALTNNTQLLNNAPTVPVLSSPANNSINTKTYQVLDWENSTDADGDSITYNLSVISVNGSTIFTGLTASQANLTTPEGLYNWTVQAYDGFESSNWSIPRTFRVEFEPGYILAPICTHGRSWANCTWTDPPINFHHLYIVNQTASNNTWDSNVSAGVQFRNFTGLSKGTYNYSTQAVTAAGNINSTIVWLNTTVNDNGFPFTNKSISESIINQNSGTEIITVSIHDNDGNITNATVTLTYFGVPFTYIMTNASGETWSYNFRSGNAGAYTVTSFNATDDSGDTNGATWGQSFIVVPVTAGGSTGGGTEGSVPIPTTIIPTPTPGAKQTFTPATQINLPNIAQDPIGVMMLQGLLILGVVMVALFFFKPNVRIGTPVAGLLIIILSSWTMGWWQ